MVLTKAPPALDGDEVDRQAPRAPQVRTPPDLTHPLRLMSAGGRLVVRELSALPGHLLPPPIRIVSTLLKEMPAQVGVMWGGAMQVLMGTGLSWRPLGEGVKHCPRGVSGSRMGSSAPGPGLPAEAVTASSSSPSCFPYLGPGLARRGPQALPWPLGATPATTCTA